MNSSTPPQRRFNIDLPGSMITIVIPSLTAQVHHQMFGPSTFPELHVTALFSALRRGEVIDGYRWVLNAGDPSRFVVLHQSQMLGLINLALANQWIVKGYTPQETQNLINPLTE